MRSVILNFCRLVYNYFRGYEPSSGLYVQSDPIGLLRDYSDPKLALDVGGLPLSASNYGINHSFVYVDQNPLLRFDLLGLVGGQMGRKNKPMTLGRCMATNAATGAFIDLGVALAMPAATLIQLARKAAVAGASTAMSMADCVPEKPKKIEYCPID